MKVVPTDDVVGYREESKTQFKARSDDVLYQFWEDRYILREREENTARIIELENSINSMFIKIAMNKGLNGGYIRSSIYERMRKFNRRINDFRTGRKIISAIIANDCLNKLFAIGRILNTSSSNIFRLCVFETLNPGDYQDNNTIQVFSAILVDYQTIMEQINDMLRDLNVADDNITNIVADISGKVNDSTYRT